MASFSIALSGLTAASTDLDVTANNIANANTVGFKSSRAEFADVYAAGAVNLNQSQTGEGVRIASIAQQFTQGNISTTAANLDLAISGNGFFTLNGPDGYVYTRNGQFGENSNGNVISSTGQALQVYPPLAGGGFNTGALSDLNLQTAQSAPQATTGGVVSLNLPAGATPPTGGAFDPTNPQTYNQSTSTTIYDSLGNAYSATYYFVNTGANTWKTYLGIANPGGTTTVLPAGAPSPGEALGFTSSGAFQPTPPAVGTNINFGTFTPAGGAAPQNLTFDFGKTTQFGGQFGVTAISQNGYATGQLSTVSIDPTGIVSAVYTNGRTTQLGQVAMANFPNPQGLEQLGDTNWSETFTSGNAVQGTAGSAGFGSIQSGALEASNVDLTTELVTMITSQRAFQANAQVITTANQESLTVININH